MWLIEFPVIRIQRSLKLVAIGKLSLNQLENILVNSGLHDVANCILSSHLVDVAFFYCKVFTKHR